MERVMPIKPTTYNKIISSMEEFDRDLRQSEKWSDWENNKAHYHAIKQGGRIYPVKKIVAMASGTPVSDFSGGWGSKTHAANSYSQALGFKIIPLRHRNPAWSRDELIVTLDFYFRHKDKIPGKKSQEVKELSGLLNRIGSQIHTIQSDDFRNPNGVYMKLMNYRGLDPNHSSQGLKHGGKGDQEVWNEFSSDLEKCQRHAQAITTAIHELEIDADTEPNTDETEFEAEEGRVVARVHSRRERNRKIVNKKKSAVLRHDGFLSCEACGFRFDETYGERGANFIECHHVKPVHEMRPGETTKLSDLVLLCSNCHRMVHAKRPWLTLDGLKTLITSLLLLLFSTVAYATESTVLTGTVTHVRDGDTIEVGKIPIRLNGVSAPELNEPLGQQSKQFMLDLVDGMSVRCELTGAKTYDRLVGTCYLDDQDIGVAVISTGLALDCPRYSGGRYAEFEVAKAREQIKLLGYCQ
jgi:5-methylcytosine-specific restriction enzyme A